MIRTKNIVDLPHAASGRGTHEDASYAQGALPSSSRELMDRSAIPEKYEGVQLADSGDRLYFVSDGMNRQTCGGGF